MQSAFPFLPTKNGSRVQRSDCPLLVSQATSELCDHQQFLKGKGCHKDLHWEVGGRMCVILDCTGPLYQAVYRQCTSCERINSQAKELSIERPKVGNRHSVVNLNTLIYLLLTCDHYCVLNPSIKGFYKYISCTPLKKD